ncbi:MULTISPECIES: hypothetical protein [unclassified Nocardioides]|uniref:hypothetical protein n=1 Tax=unclassified Nocardioides TaxID=2615069 RepID=UPI003622D768
MPRSQNTAGIFDIRNIIGGLIGVYGIILLAMGLFGDRELEKTDGVNANLWAGLAMAVFGAAFIAWAWLRPVRVPHDPDDAAGPGDQDAG